MFNDRHRMGFACTLALVCLVQVRGGTTSRLQADDDFRSILQRIVTDLQGQYNMSVAAALYRGDGGISNGQDLKKMPPNTSVAVAAGYTDAGLDMGHASRKALPDDVYVWGSITKMYTGPAVLQLVEKGLVNLNDPISMHVDPLLEHINGTKLIDHFGANISQVQIHHLLHMTSGLEDFDGEDYAQYQFSHRHYDFSPIEIVGKYVPGRLRYPPGSRQSYCSTNYVLLGLVLANHIHGTSGNNYSWSTYSQKDVIPAALRAVFKTTDFINHGPCSDHTPVHGFTAGYTTAVIPPQDVWNVSCAGGWTAGNYLGSVSDVAQYTYDLYNVANPAIVSRESVAHMINFTAPDYAPGHAFKFYGMGTFNLDWSVGNGTTAAYGHVGDTYGYQSQTTYFPSHDFVLTVATNVETNTQKQPAQFTCLAFNEILAALEGHAAPKCEFIVPHHFIGTCNCSY